MICFVFCRLLKGKAPIKMVMAIKRKMCVCLCLGVVVFIKKFEKYIRLIIKNRLTEVGIRFV